MSCQDADSPRISIITPAYNPINLKGVVDALNAQSFKNFEWVLINDGSARAFNEVFEAAINRARFPFKLIRLEKNSGQAEARNVGVREAQGAFIKFLDADDSLDTLHLEALLSPSEHSLGSKVIFFAPTRHVFIDRGFSFVNSAYETAGHTPETQLIHLLTSPFLHHCGALFPRALLLDLGTYDATLITDEDGDLLIRVLRSGYHFEPVPSSNYIYIHHCHERRVSHDNSIAKLESRKRVCIKLIESYRQGEDSIPTDIQRGICKRLDKIVVSNWLTHKNFCKELLAFAEDLAPGYPRSGSGLERFVRRLFGVGTAAWGISTFRAIRGRFKGRFA